MGLSKTESFTAYQNKMSGYAKALAHPARIAILQVLIKKNACICNDIVEELPIAQATVSQHLKELKTAGIITGNIEGSSICYCIDKNNWEEVKKLFNVFFDTVYTEANCC